MNKLIQKELDKLHDAHIESYDELKHIYHISLKKNSTLELKHTYILELSDSLLDGNDVTTINWNKGKHPTHKYVKGYVTKNMSQMLYIYCVYYNIETDTESTEEWNGWLSINSIKVIKEV